MANKEFLDTWTFDETLKVLSHTTSSSLLYKLLSSIRKRVEWPQHLDNIDKLHKSGRLKQIIGALRSSHLHIVAVALSILGNSCMDERNTNDVLFSYNGIPELIQLLKRYPQDDGVNGRVFRIIGNMCQYRADSIIDRKPQIVTYIVQFIQTYAENESDEIKFSEATIVMALRAFRQLLNGRTFINLVKNFGALKAIGTLLIKCSNRWIDEKKDTHILDNVIKFLLHYSKYRYYPGITELRNTPKGNSLIYLSYLLPLASKKIVKIVTNLTRISQLKSELPIPELFSAFVKLLKENPIAQDFKDEYREYIKCLCFLLEHPANRNTVRCRETIPQLIKILDDFQNPDKKALESCILIITTFAKCSFHDPLLQEQLGCNIVQVLVKKLEWITASSENLLGKHKIQRRRKRKYSNDICAAKKRIGMTYSQLREPRSPVSSEDDFDHLGYVNFRLGNRCSSPSSGSESEAVFSPWSSPSVSSLTGSQDLSDSEDYSPVCSDNEDDEESSNIPKEEHQTSVEIERLSDAEDQKSEDVGISGYSLKYRLLKEILHVLKTFSVMQPSPTELCSEPLLLVLFKCCTYFEQHIGIGNVAMLLIGRILEIHDYLIPLMQTEVIATAYSLIKTPHGSFCLKCSGVQQNGHKILQKFSSLAESGRGKGDIANRLICGSDEVKKQLVLSIPYIVRNRSILHSLMLNCGGLDLLMDLLLDAQLQQKSVHVVCALALNTLGICSPQQWPRHSREKLSLNEYSVAVDCTNIVTFVLDDNSRLKADRDFLCEKSCFFNSLLNGSFKESNENLVKLHNTDYGALNGLIRLLHCDFDKTEPRDVQMDIRTLLEVIMLCDRYLLEDLCVFLTECVQQFGMTAENVPVIYKWSIESKTNILRVEAIAFALVGVMTDSDRLSMFTDLFSLGYSEDIVSDIRKLLVRYLTMRGLS